MTHYADSSFLVSCYLTDANTPQANAYLSRTGSPLAWTALHALEVRNAFELGVFRGIVTTTEIAAAWANLENDLRRARLVRTTVKWPVVFRAAARLSERHSATIGTRSLDIMRMSRRQNLSAPRSSSLLTRASMH